MTTDDRASIPAQSDADVQSYVARHWRGELSLARSYWLNGFLIVSVGGAVIFYVTPLMLALVVFGLRYTPLEWVLALSFLAWFGLCVWAWGGIWRSAGNYRGPRIWPIAARIAVVVGTVVSLLIVLTGFFNALAGLA